MDVLDKFKERLVAELDVALPIVCQELEDMKKSYFSPQGKEGWQPLKENTVKRKNRRSPNHANSFNLEYGYLRNSINIDYQLSQNEIEIIVTANHREGDGAINRLIYDYGRDFFNFDEKEIAFIVRRLRELIAESFR